MLLFCQTRSYKNLLRKYRKGRRWVLGNSQKGLLLHKKKLLIPSGNSLQATIISFIHDSCHEVYQKSLCRIACDFYWPGMRGQIRAYVSACPVCQRNKVDHLKPAGLLQPLSAPYHIWADISMDFIEGLQSSQGKNVILTVVDRFSKYAHFIALSHSYNAGQVARTFFDNIFKLHGLPESIVCDRTLHSLAHSGKISSI